MDTKNRSEDEEPGARGDRRGDSRRERDRRLGDRRFPVPMWRRPWAYTTYGVLAALVLVLVVSSLGEDEAARDAGQVVTVMAPPPVDPNSPPAALAPTQDAYAVGDFERLLAAGGEAVGQRVRTELFCEPMQSMALRDVDAVNRSVAELADARRTVPAASCKWGADESAPDFLLLVPPALAEQLAAAPEVTLRFVRRRRLDVELEWLGRAESVSLRVAGVLRAIGSRQ